jgi:hypothetical protein
MLATPSALPSRSRSAPEGTNSGTPESDRVLVDKSRRKYLKQRRVKIAALSTEILRPIRIRRFRAQGGAPKDATGDHENNRPDYGKSSLEAHSKWDSLCSVLRIGERFNRLRCPAASGRRLMAMRSSEEKE